MNKEPQGVEGGMGTIGILLAERVAGFPIGANENSEYVPDMAEANRLLQEAAAMEKDKKDARPTLEQAVEILRFLYADVETEQGILTAEEVKEKLDFAEAWLKKYESPEKG